MDSTNRGGFGLISLMDSCLAAGVRSLVTNLASPPDLPSNQGRRQLRKIWSERIIHLRSLRDRGLMNGHWDSLIYTYIYNSLLLPFPDENVLILFPGVALLTAGGMTAEAGGDFAILKIRDQRVVLPATLIEEGLRITNWTVNGAYGLCCVAQCLTCLFTLDPEGKVIMTTTTSPLECS